MSEYADEQRANPQLLKCDYVWRFGLLNYVFNVSKDGKRLKVAETPEPEDNAEWVSFSEVELLTNQERCDQLGECDHPDGAEDDCEPSFDPTDTGQFKALGVQDDDYYGLGF